MAGRFVPCNAVLWFICSILYLHLPTTRGQRGVPVIILDEHRVMPDTGSAFNPLKMVNPGAFHQIINVALKKAKVIIIFVEDSLSVEDFSIKDKHGTPFEYIGEMVKAKRAIYYPSVKEPYSELAKSLKPDKSNVFEVTDQDDKMRIYKNKLKYYYIFFRDAREDKRTKSLRLHDKVISEVYKAVQKMTEGHVVCFYMAIAPPKDMPVLVPLTESDPGVLVRNDAGIFYLKNVVHVDKGTRAILKARPSLAHRDWSHGGLKMNVSYESVLLQFNFDFWQNYWTLDGVDLYVESKLVGHSFVGAMAHIGTAYACSYPISVEGEGVSVSIGQYQIMPRKPASDKATASVPVEVSSHNGRKRRQGESEEEKSENEEKQGKEGEVGGGEGEGEGGGVGGESKPPVQQCSIYFTTPILSGLLCTALFLSIMFWGIVMIMDVHVHDKYDDVHGKPLVIATEDHH